jgi:hypothetical protein
VEEKPAGRWCKPAAREHLRKEETTIDEEQKARLIPLATAKPEKTGVPITQGTGETLQEAIIAQGMIPPISRAPVSYFSKGASHRRRSWEHPYRDDWERFVEQMTDIGALQTQAQAQDDEGTQRIRGEERRSGCASSVPLRPAWNIRPHRQPASGDG